MFLAEPFPPITCAAETTVAAVIVEAVGTIFVWGVAGMLEATGRAS